MQSERPGDRPMDDTETAMTDDGPVTDDSALIVLGPARLISWRATFVIGFCSLILGLIVAFRPTESLTVITVLLGILAIFSGVFHIVDAVESPPGARVWPAIAGVLFIVVGIVMIRHLRFSLAVIGLFIGFTWVIQGVAALVLGLSGDRQGTFLSRWWPVIFGVVSLVAGIVVISTPVSSIAVLATFLGIWFAVMGVFEMVDALVWRHRSRHRRGAAGQVSVPGQRAGETSASARTGDSAPGGASVQG
jgi:uncharacterized membrane protein HdeD (DUF308 family)